MGKFIILKIFSASFETSPAVIDVFAGRQRRDRSIGEEVKVEAKSQGIAWMPEAVRQKMKGTIHKHIITQIPKMETSWNMVCLVSL